MSSLEKCLFMSSAYFLIGSFAFFFLLLSGVSCLYILEISPCQLHHLQIISLFLRLFFFIFYFFNGFLSCTKACKFD